MYGTGTLPEYAEELKKKKPVVPEPGGYISKIYSPLPEPEPKSKKKKKNQLLNKEPSSIFLL